MHIIWIWDYNELYGFIWGKKVGLMEYPHLWDKIWLIYGL
jgi:hypothetical protein